MAILNYTTTVPVGKTVAEIQGKLARAKAEKAKTIRTETATERVLDVQGRIRSAIGNNPEAKAEPPCVLVARARQNRA